MDRNRTFALDGRPMAVTGKTFRSQRKKKFSWSSPFSPRQPSKKDSCWAGVSARAYFLISFSLPGFFSQSLTVCSPSSCLSTLVAKKIRGKVEKSTKGVLFLLPFGYIQYTFLIHIAHTTAQEPLKIYSELTLLPPELGFSHFLLFCWCH